MEELDEGWWGGKICSKLMVCIKKGKERKGKGVCFYVLRRTYSFSTRGEPHHITDYVLD